MKVTNAMEDAYLAAAFQPHEQYAGDWMGGIQAVLDLIDPVPADVNVITDKEGDEWARVGKTSWYFDMLGVGRSTFDLITTYGPITWRGRCNNCDPLEAGASATRTDGTEGDEACRDCNRKVKA